MDTDESESASWDSRARVMEGTGRSHMIRAFPTRNESM